MKERCVRSLSEVVSLRSLEIRMRLSFPVVRLFNVIQQSQLSYSAAEESKASRGSGKPTLPAPSTSGKGKNRGKNKDNILGRAKEGE